MEITLSLQEHEESVVEAAVQKKKWAQKQIYEEFFSSMMGVCLRYTKDEHEAMDLLHDGFLKVFKNLANYKPNTSLRAWIKRIMINNCIDYLRKSIRRRTEDIDTAFGVSSNDPSIINSLSEKEILASIQKLTPIYRTVFNMYVIEGFSHREISKTMGITESTSRSNLVKARSKLRELIHHTYHKKLG